MSDEKMGARVPLPVKSFEFIYFVLFERAEIGFGLDSWERRQLLKL